MACGIHVVLNLSIPIGHLITLLNSYHPMSPDSYVIFDSYDHFATVTIIFGQLRSYPVDSYDHVADVWFVSYDHITQVSQAHISKTNAQTNKAWHAKPRPMTSLYCVQIREHSVAYMRHNRPCPNSPSPTPAILYDRNCYDRNCFPTVIVAESIISTNVSRCVAC